MFNIALYEPEIPPNTGNIMRLCANAGARLHLIHPLGFTLDDRQLRRAGLDYPDYAGILEYTNLGDCRSALADSRFFAFSTRGRRRYTRARFQRDDALLFGPETRGLPRSLLDRLGEENVLRLPMRAGNRSLNLSNAVAIAVYEAWRQTGFEEA